MSKNWWSQERLTGFGGGMIHHNWPMMGLSLYALENGCQVYSAMGDGAVKEGTDILAAIAEASAGMTPLYLPIKDDVFCDYIYVSPTRTLVFNYRTEDGGIDWRAESTEKDWVEKVSDLVKSFVVRRAAKGRIYVMTSGPNGIGFTSLGMAAVPMERDNYTPDAMDGYDHIVEDIRNISPCGRVIVMNGVPGTGKTFMVRSLLADCKEATFVLVQAHLVASLGDPQLIPAIMGLKRNRPDGPIVFVVEDADACLASRSTDNISSISAILNFGDGIYGSMLDIRIIATTNAKAEDLDEAIVRPGRLCKRLDLGELSAEQSKKVYSRLTKLELKCGKSDTFTLAEIYRLARQDGWKPEIVKPSKLGFSFDHDEY